MDWEECNTNMLVKSVKPDEEMIKSLVKSSANKVKSEKKEWTEFVKNIETFLKN